MKWLGFFLTNSWQDKQLYTVMFWGGFLATFLSWELYSLSPDCCSSPLTGWQGSIDPSWEDVMKWQQQGLLFAQLRRKKYQTAVLASLPCLKRKKMCNEQCKWYVWLLLPLQLGWECIDIKSCLAERKSTISRCTFMFICNRIERSTWGLLSQSKATEKRCFIQRVHRMSCLHPSRGH